VLTATLVVGNVPLASVVSAADPSSSPGPTGSPPVFPALPSFTVSPDAQLATDAKLVPAALPPMPAIDIGAAWKRSQALVSSTPASQWQTTALADSLNDDPMAAFALVRDSTGFDPYAGELRGPYGTLAARAGNSLDRALLLKRLLDVMLVPSRLVRGTLDDTTAAALVARSFQPPAKPLSSVPIDEQETGPFDSIVSRARRDYALLRGALGDRLSKMDGAANAQALAATKDHFWVQMAFGAQWVDLDPSMPDAQPGQTLTQPQQFLDSVPEELQQTVTIRVLAETLSNGLLSESPVLEQHFSAPDAAQSELYLSFVPAITGTGSTIAQALGSTTSWEPVLNVAGNQVTGTPFPVAPGTDLFTGEAQDGPQVSRLRLETTIQTPGLDPITRDEVLLDRVPRSVRGSTTAIDPAQLEPLANVKGLPADLLGLYHIQVSTGGLDTRAHQAFRGIAAQLSRTESLTPDAVNALGFPFNALPASIDDEAMVVSSEDVIRDALNAEPDVHAYVARPRVFVNAGGPSPDGKLWILADLMSDGVAYVTDGNLAPADAAARQVWYGSLETALETQLTALRGQKVFSDAGTTLGTSLSMDQPLTVIDPSGSASLPSSASPGLVEAVKAGQIAIVPGDPATSRVWWTVDPATGETRSIVDPGYGGQLATGVPELGPAASVDQNPYTNATPNSGPRYVIEDFDPDAPPYTQADYEKVYQEALAQEEAAAKPPAPQGGCGGSEEATLLCTIAIGAAVAFAVIGIIVYFVV
jgi:hypothetical protein